jgi:parvulin-like peptidyl-prolyl isomerase
VLPALLALAAPPSAVADEMLNKIVLRVNDQIATLYDYQLRRADAIQEVQRRIHDPKELQEELSQVGENVFRDMFQELLLNSRADQLAIDATDQEVDDKIVEMKKSFGIKTDLEFKQALEQSGITLEMLRTQTRRRIRIQDVLGKEVQAKVKVKDEDVRRYYRKNEAEFRVPEQVQLREVVVLDESGLSAAERGRIAGEIRTAVSGGKSLADAVAPFVAKGQTSNVVELGWVSPKDLDPKLEEAGWKLAKNAVSEPVDARGGLHLLQLEDRHEAHVKPFSEVQSQIQQREQQRVYIEESTKYMADLETRSLVVADPPRDALNFRKKIGASEDDNMQGLSGGGSKPATAPPDAAPAAPAPAAPAAANATSGSLDQVVPTPAPVLDTTDRQKDKGGLPAPQPAGVPPNDKVLIPPPSPSTPVPPPSL